MINTIGIQEAWEAAGGNPGIKATKAELIEALNSLDEACDAIRDDAGQQGVEDEKLIVNALKKLIGEYWTLAYNEGKEGRDHDTENSDAQRTLFQINERICDLTFSRLPAPAKTYTFDEILDERGPEHRAKVEKRFKELLADYKLPGPVSIPQQPTAEPAVESATHWEENASYLLDRCKHSVRVREGGGPENLLSSLIATFMGMEQKLAIRAAPAVEACLECGKVGVICKKPTCAMLRWAAEPAVESTGRDSDMIKYSPAVGQAAEDYLRRFPNAHPLPAQWRWEDLFDAMVAALSEFSAP